MGASLGPPGACPFGSLCAGAQGLEREAVTPGSPVSVTSVAPSAAQSAGRSAWPEALSERDRLSGLVGAFVREAGRGRSVTLLRELALEPLVEEVASELRVSKRLDRLILATLDGAALQVPFAAIRDVYTRADDGAGAFPSAMLSSLAEPDLGRLLRIVYRAPKGRAKSLFFLESSPASRRQLFEAMRVLHSKARAAPRLPKTLSGQTGSTRASDETSKCSDCDLAPTMPLAL
mmetsp:Transcript_104001/g.291379  ORF Transcript_104001/g.291379 Transcript_104001/m.291379 type:complete len:233 (+) Transcript_104001:59-757(+)